MKRCQLPPAPTFFALALLGRGVPEPLETPAQMTFDPLPAAWDTFKFWDSHETSTDNATCNYLGLYRLVRPCTSAGEPARREKEPGSQRGKGSLCGQFRKRLRSGGSLLQLHDGAYLRATVRGFEQPGLRYEGHRGVQKGLCTGSEIAGDWRAACGDVLESAAHTRSRERSEGYPQARPERCAVAEVAGKNLSAKPGRRERRERTIRDGQQSH